MRLNWIVNNHTVSNGDMHTACAEFYIKYKVVPDTIKLSYRDYAQYLSTHYSYSQTLERDKKYGMFIVIPGGLVEIILLEEDGESTMSTMGGTIMVVESSQVDREFEKHILNKDEK